MRTEAPLIIALLGACAEPASDPAWVQGLELQLSPDMPTVVELVWETSEPAVGQVRYGAASATGAASSLDQASPWEIEPSTEHSALLLGLNQRSRYELELWNERDGEIEVSERLVVETGTLPELVTPTVSRGSAAEPAGGFTLVPVRDPSDEGALVLFDGDGQAVWAHQPPELPAVSRARLSRDGRSLLYLRSVAHPDETGALMRVPLSGGDGEVLCEIPGAFMDFVEIEPGLVATIAVELFERDDGARTIARETLVEVDEQCGLRTVWDFIDAMELDLDEPFMESLFGDDIEVPAHLNSLSYDPEADLLLVTAANRQGVYAVDRQSGETAWVLARKGGDFTASGDEEDLAFDPHSAEAVDGGVLVFDRGFGEGACSAALEYTLDHDAMVATRLPSLPDPDCASTAVLGNAQRLWTGDTLLVLAMAGRIDELTPDGELLWRMDLPVGNTFGYAERVESLYP